MSKVSQQARDNNRRARERASSARANGEKLQWLALSPASVRAIRNDPYARLALHTLDLALAVENVAKSADLTVGASDDEKSDVAYILEGLFDVRLKLEDIAANRLQHIVRRLNAAGGIVLCDAAGEAVQQ